VVDFAKADLHENRPLAGIIWDIKQLLHMEWRCEILDTLGEGNFAADALAESACELHLDVELLRHQPDFMTHFLNADARGFFFPKGFTFS